MSFQIHPPILGQDAVCEAILRSLPEWFGNEEALIQYVRDIETMPTFLATEETAVAGFLTIRQDNPFSAEIHVMAVRPASHRKGIGNALVAHAQEWLAAKGTEYLQVKTLAPSRPNAAYARTRAFYLALGFRPLEEFDSLWGAGTPCLQLIKRLADRPDAAIKTSV